jgi:hypothetical protein
MQESNARTPMTSIWPGNTIDRRPDLQGIESGAKSSNSPELQSQDSRHFRTPPKSITETPDSVQDDRRPVLKNKNRQCDEVQNIARTQQQSETAVKKDRVANDRSRARNADVPKLES